MEINTYKHIDIYGFKAKTSTSHALVDATHYSMSILDNGHFTMEIFISFLLSFKAFHNMLPVTLNSKFVIKCSPYAIRSTNILSQLFVNQIQDNSVLLLLQ